VMGPVRAQLAWLRGGADEAIAGWREALAAEDEIDVFGQASETRVRLAAALARRGALAEAAGLLGVVFQRAQDDGGPGGALLARIALRELAALSWGDALPATSPALLQAWAGAATAARTPPGEGVDPRADALTARERQVLERIARGESNKLIARALDISLHTVKRHVANILAKLAVDTRGQAAARFASRAR
ncbi:MAG TPA: helix-turn-helix transcriptional regulator, partial [Myxococcota bacterium]|nr:helix-turn-helix transcriptional regulator [Myxococcota bacterium]